MFRTGWHIAPHEGPAGERRGVPLVPLGRLEAFHRRYAPGLREGSVGRLAPAPASDEYTTRGGLLSLALGKGKCPISEGSRIRKMERRRPLSPHPASKIRIAQILTRGYPLAAVRKPSAPYPDPFPPESDQATAHQDSPSTRPNAFR